MYDEKMDDTSSGGDGSGESFISISYLKKGCKSYASFEVTDISNTSVKNVSDDDNVLNTKESQMYCLPMIQARKSD